MKIICVIPARYASTRFPGKPLVNIFGKPLIQRVWERAKLAKLVNKVIIATDDKRIFDKAKEFGAQVIMTSVNCKTGTDRIAQAVKKINCDIVVNLQGDEPLISPKLIDKTIQAILDDKSAAVSTPICAPGSGEKLDDTNIAKVVFDKNMHALYFSRSVIPDSARFTGTGKKDFYYKHIGLYVYRKNFLEKFVKLKESTLEKAEKLEQLRIIENGYKIKVVIVENDGAVDVDVPGDVRIVEGLIKKGGR
ncbi:MAG: 3-deoxy-manno-octulosonate cytidylyltransferase [Elusimicrobia bacterium]|nr:3-deoxy-manno-octulosonate cytidylyltransferase [Elusimicrobiota bacterium]MBU2615253.1 3-deoxy-manno-octulosonate cytidylyltransferase [Elusimicrobiota bacterium]